MFFRIIACLFPLLTLTFSMHAIEQQNDIFIYMVSHEGDPIGLNQSYVFDNFSGHYEIHRIKPPSPNEVKGFSITLNQGQRNGWQFKFAIPVNVKLASGKYINAQSYPYHSSDRAGLKVCKMDQDFKDIYGEFEILEFKFDSKNKIVSLAIDFLQTASSQGQLFGSIRFNSSVPLPLSYQ